MRKIYFLLYVLFLMLISFSVYQVVEAKWVRFRLGEIAYNKGNYAKAYKYYLLAIKNGFSSDIFFDHLSTSARIIDKVNDVFDTYKQLIAKKTDDKQSYHDLALFYSMFREEDLAITYFEELLKSKKNPIIYDILGKLYQRDGRYFQAIDNYKKYLDIKDDFYAHLQLANLYLIIGQKGKAIEQLQKILSINPDFLLAKLKFVDILLSNDEIAKATQILQKIKVNEIEDQSELVLACLYLDQKEFKKADKVIESYLKNNPNDIKARYYLAEAYEKTKKFDQTIDQYKKILSIKNDFQIRRKLGKIYFLKCDYKKAEYELRKSFEDENYSIVNEDNRITNFEAKLLLAEVYIKNGTPKNAILILFPLLDQTDKPLDVHVLLYQAYFDEKQYEKALNEVKYIKKYIKKDDADKLEGKVYLAKNEHKKACVFFEKFPQILPENKYLLVELAKAYLWNLNFRKAIEIYLALLNQEPDNYAWMAKLADIYFIEGQYTNAILYYSKILKDNPNNHDIKRSLAISYSNNEEEDKAIEILKSIFDENNKDRLIGIELVKNYVKIKNYSEAFKVINILKSQYENDPSVIKSEFYIYYGQGLRKKAYSFFKANEGFLNPIDKAELFIKLNYFYEAEKCYLSLLKGEKKDIPIMNLLGKLYTIMKRYNEAEGIYVNIFYNVRNNKKVFLDYVRLKIAEKEFDKAEEIISKALSIFPDDIDLIWEQSIVYLFKNENAKAIKIYNDLLSYKLYRKKALLELGKIYFKEDIKKSREYFQKALDEDTNLFEAKFYLYYPEKKPNELFNDMSIDEMLSWAYLYKENDDPEMSYYLFKKILDEDEDNYYAKKSMADWYISQSDFKEAIVYLDQILKDFPKDYNILIEKARALSWMEDFDESIAIYKELISNNNSLIIRDIARTYAWNQDLKKAKREYDLLLSPSVDELLIKKVPELFSKKTILDKKPYYFYEKVKNDIDKEILKNDDIKNEVLNLYGIYRIQKSTYLEKIAKNYFGNSYFIHAINVYKELIDFEPWNEEAIFDLAQSYCYFGICNESKKIYKNILKKNIYHSLAKEAYNLNVIKSHPSINPKYRFFREQGRGELDRITKNRAIFDINIPIYCKNELSIGGVFWNDRPNFPHNTQVRNENSLAKSYYSYGIKAEWKQILNEYISLKAGVEQKHYIKDFTDRTSGYFHLFFNIYDYMKLQGMFDQENKIDNYFGLKHGTQFRRILVKTFIPIKNIIDIDGSIRFYYFNDKNKMQYHNLNIDLHIVNNPVLFKLSFLGEYRDTRKQNVYIYDGNDLVDIKYPYWTPDEYWAYRVAIDLIGDFSKIKFCGNEKRYYMLDIKVGNDTENNPTVIVDGLLHYEFYKHWAMEIKGLVHRSTLWNSEEVKAEIQYRF